KGRTGDEQEAGDCDRAFGSAEEGREGSSEKIELIAGFVNGGDGAARSTEHAMSELTTGAVPVRPGGAAETAADILPRLGPGLITGAADDDPSGIATYSQVGAQFGFGMLWTMLFSFPLMA